MFGILKKRKRDHRSTDKPRLTDRAARKGAGIIISLQRKWAESMHQLTRNWTVTQKKIALVCFCTLLGAHSGIALYQAFNPRPKKQTVIPVTRIRQPLIQESRIRAPSSGDPAYRRVRQIHAWLDSLQTTTEGRKRYDSLMKKRPGLMDTIITIENFYQIPN